MDLMENFKSHLVHALLGFPRDTRSQRKKLPFESWGQICSRKSCGDHLTQRLEERFEMGAGVGWPEGGERTPVGRAPLAEVGSWRVAEALSFGIPNSGRPCPLVGTRKSKLFFYFSRNAIYWIAWFFSKELCLSVSSSGGLGFMKAGVLGQQKDYFLESFQG